MPGLTQGFSSDTYLYLYTVIDTQEYHCEGATSTRVPQNVPLGSKSSRDGSADQRLRAQAESELSFLNVWELQPQQIQRKKEKPGSFFKQPTFDAAR